MTSDLRAAPMLSTPAEYTFTEDPTSTSAFAVAQAQRPRRPDHELYQVYEVPRTAAEIQRNDWRRIALQFPDDMLPDAPWVVDALSTELQGLVESSYKSGEEESSPQKQGQGHEQEQKYRLYILADTSYSACCVDEIAAEHANADVLVHYGRACLSPTSRLPVVHIFTRQTLDYDAIAGAFEREFPDKTVKVAVMADVMFQEHVVPLCELLRDREFSNVVATEIVRDPSGSIPNRRLVSPNTLTVDHVDYNLNEYHLFHVSTPPTSLLLTLDSRLASLRIYPTPSSSSSTVPTLPDPSATPSILRRRYALVIQLATASIIGILVNTLSVKNYMSTISTLKNQIATAGKKSYTIVVGKLNAAKLANFAEVDGWVVVGCWESGMVEQEGLWKPVVTPFELGLALQSEESRVWTGEWWAGIEGVKSQSAGDMGAEIEDDEAAQPSVEEVEGGVDDEESEPPEFDLRTGKLISHSRPMRVAIRSIPRSADELNGTTLGSDQNAASSAVVMRATGGVALVNGVASPGAEFLRSQRTWQGLSTDYDEEESAVVEEGRSGIARGYTVGLDQTRT
ncbi:Diphthamide biosynthesis protein 2 [Parahypoxylon ruwenzoriense]